MRFFFSLITLNSSCVGTNGLNCRAASSPGACAEASKRGAFLASSAVSIQSPALLLNFYSYSSRENSLPAETRRATASQPPLPVPPSARRCCGASANTGADVPHKRRLRVWKFTLPPEKQTKHKNEDKKKSWPSPSRLYPTSKVWGKLGASSFHSV